MKSFPFPQIALLIGVPLLLLVIKGSEIGGDGTTVLPLLTLLIVCEFGAILSAIGVYTSIKTILTKGFELKAAILTTLCGLLSLRFLFLGLALWPL